MRVLGFNQMWPKLQQDTFTTFRFQRKDRDYYPAELLQIVYRPRSKGREVLGAAKIISIEPRSMNWGGSKLTQPKVTNAEANEDGFPDAKDHYGNRKSGYYYMWEWLWDTYRSKRLLGEPMNKLTLKWVKPKRVVYMLDGKPQVAEVGGSPWGAEGDKAVDTGGETRLEVVKVLEWRETVSPLGGKA